MKSAWLGLVAVVASIVCACSGGGSSGGAASAAPGELSIELTDAPFDYSVVAEASLRVREVKVHREAQANSGFVTLYSGPGIDVDLLDLLDGARHLLVRADLAPGIYRQVRLIIDEARLELTNGNVYSTQLGNLNLTSLDTSGLKIMVNPGIEVVSALSQTLLLDIDLSKTFHPIPANDALNANSYQLHPVVKAANLSETGEIRGYVLADDGQGGTTGVDMATVYVLPPGETDPANSVAATGSLSDGRYAVIGLLPGTYDVLARKGSQEALAPSQTVNVGNVTTVDLTLQ